MSAETAHQKCGAVHELAGVEEVPAADARRVKRALGLVCVAAVDADLGAPVLVRQPDHGGFDEAQVGVVRPACGAALRRVAGGGACWLRVTPPRLDEQQQPRGLPRALQYTTTWRCDRPLQSTRACLHVHCTVQAHGPYSHEHCRPSHRGLCLSKQQQATALTQPSVQSKQVPRAIRATGAHEVRQPSAACMTGKASHGLPALGL